MDLRIAVPVTAKTTDEALNDINRATNAKADIIELRIDYMKNPDLERLLAASSLPVIVTNRHNLEGGRFQGSEKDRIRYLQQAIDLGAQYVDIEAHYFHDSLTKKPETNIILSYHNFEKTPDNLREIYNSMASNSKADIVKLATKAKYNSDSIRMLDLVASKSEEKSIIGICMGDKGILTRILGPIFGSYLTFASLDKEKASAPGQLTIGELRALWRSLSSKLST